MVMFARSLESDKFEILVEILDQLLTWMFFLNQVHYARWLPIYIQTVEGLPDQHLKVYEGFKKGRCTVQKTQRHFSRISDDQGHEQNNKVIERVGDAIRIVDPPISLAKWIIADPEIARMLSSFDETLSDYVESTELCSHQENTAFFKNMFEKAFKNLKYEFEKKIFFEDTERLYILVTKN